MYQREGSVQNGLYPTNSFGKSEQVTFENFGFKAGLQLKILGKQLVTFNAAHLTKAPSLRNTFAFTLKQFYCQRPRKRKPKQCRCQLHFRSQN
jgi:hypothetical protein